MGVWAAQNSKKIKKNNKRKEIVDENKNCKNSKFWVRKLTHKKFQH